MFDFTDFRTASPASNHWVENTALVRLHRCCVEEIQKHKWIESEKAGFDIGWTVAEKDWYRRYGRQFKQHFTSSRI